VRATWIFLYWLDCPGVYAAGKSPTLYARLHAGSLAAHHWRVAPDETKLYSGMDRVGPRSFQAVSRGIFPAALASSRDIPRGVG
jgi:hypothetical protein